MSQFSKQEPNFLDINSPEVQEKLGKALKLIFELKETLSFKDNNVGIIYNEKDKAFLPINAISALLNNIGKYVERVSLIRETPPTTFLAEKYSIREVSHALIPGKFNFYSDNITKTFAAICGEAFNHLPQNELGLLLIDYSMGNYKMNNRPFYPLDQYLRSSYGRGENFQPPFQHSGNTNMFNNRSQQDGPSPFARPDVRQPWSNDVGAPPIFNDQIWGQYSVPKNWQEVREAMRNKNQEGNKPTQTERSNGNIDNACLNSDALQHAENLNEVFDFNTAPQDISAMLQEMKPVTPLETPPVTNNGDPESMKQIAKRILRDPDSTEIQVDNKTDSEPNVNKD